MGTAASARRIGGHGIAANRSSPRPDGARRAVWSPDAVGAAVMPPGVYGASAKTALRWIPRGLAAPGNRDVVKTAEIMLVPGRHHRHGKVGYSVAAGKPPGSVFRDVTRGGNLPPPGSRWTDVP